MPSDPRVAAALAALAQPIAEFRTAVEGALAQADAFLASHTAGPDVRAARVRAELGAFGDGLFDPARFAAVLAPTGGAAPASIATLKRAVDTLRAVTGRGEDLFVAEVTAGRKLGATVDAALGEAGRAFGAIVIAELVRANRYKPDEHDRLLDAFEFRAWNRAERRFAPPLVVQLDGADVHAGALTDFADGREKLLLVVSGACAPAPLVRCITPGTLVVQSVGGAGLERIAGFDGPAIAALVPEGCAEFAHDPHGGNEPWQRMQLGHIPAAPQKAIGGQSTWQMAQDLSLLSDLARTPFVVPAGAGAGTPAMGAADAADRIATWLLGQTGLSGGATA